jgi:hypothetical protein
MKPLQIVTAFSLLCILACKTNGTRPPQTDPVPIECSFEVLPRNNGPIPSVIEVDFKNNTGTTIEFTRPNPLCGESNTPPFVGVVLKDGSGENESFSYVLIVEKQEAAPSKVSLRPGQHEKIKYDLSQFYRWGPCGPDQYGNFLKYFQKGEKSITMEVFYVMGDERQPTNLKSSNKVEFPASHPEWLFKKRN